MLAVLLHFAVLWIMLRDERRGLASAFEQRSCRWELAWLLLVFVGARVLLFDSNPIQEIDYARYLWDGAVLANGGNPYQYAPQELDTGEAHSPEIERLRRLRDSDERASQNFARINYPEVPTIYPPLAQGVFAFSYWLAPWSLYGLRTVFFACELGTVLLLLNMLMKLGLPPWRAIIYAWSPLTIKELANSPHLDAIVVFTLTLCAWAWVTGRVRLMALSLGLGILAKTFPIILLPAAAAAVWRRDGVRRALLVCALAIGVGIAGYAPFLATAGWKAFDGFGSFATEWRRNGSIYAVVEFLSSHLFGSTGTWTFGSHARPAEEWIAQILVGSMVCGVALATALWPEERTNGKKRSDSDRAKDLLARWLIVLAVLFLCAPAANPWYATWLLPLLCVFPVRGLILLTGLVPLYYLSFYFEYHEEALRAAGLAPEDAFTWVCWAEYAPAFLLLGLEGWSYWRRSRKAVGNLTNSIAPNAPEKF